MVHLRTREDAGPGRVTAVASRRVGNAVVRNRAKRVLRAAAVEIGVQDGVDVALVARSSTAGATSTEVADELRALFPDGLGDEGRP